jgi:hypothetical protein
MRPKLLRQHPRAERRCGRPRMYDEDFLKLAGQGPNHHGVLDCRQQTRSVGEIVRGLVEIARQWGWCNDEMVQRSMTLR